MISSNKYSYLVVNADDYAYFEFVSKGILEAARNGIVRATGILANSSFFEEHIPWLKDTPNLDVGMHLNLTTGHPLSEEMKKSLVQYGSRFPEKFAITRAILLGKIKLKSVEAEWRAQIERCLSAGLNISFINSHEHIHMLPPLFKLTNKLADEYKIPHVRYSMPDFTLNSSVSALFRDSIISLLGLYDKRYCTNPVTGFFGMGQSGKLDMEYIKKCIDKMKPGKVYELMCHPGSYNNENINNSDLLSYHNWNDELEALTNPSVNKYLSDKNIKLIAYRDLTVEGNQLKVHGLRDIA